MRRFFCGVAVLLSLLTMVACAEEHTQVVDLGYQEKESNTIEFTNAQFIYTGNYAGDELSDSWTVKFYTDMEIDELGNPIGPGHIMQLALNAPYDDNQGASLQHLVGEYSSQNHSGDFNANTFVYGYLDLLDLPNGRVEIPDGTFYAAIADGTTNMDVDLLDDGRLKIALNDDGTVAIEGTLVGKQCRKRNFLWRGTAEIKSYIKEEVPNTLLQSDIELNSFVKAHIADRGDCFYLGDDSYRDFLVFLADENVEFEWGKPVGTGSVLRLDLLVPGDADIYDGIPAGTYPMLVRNLDTSFDKDDIVPYRAVSGLPNRFTAPYWSGCWYVEYVDGAWGDSYARIDGGEVVVERGEDGSHRFICNLEDCSEPRFKVTSDVVIARENILGIEDEKPEVQLTENQYSINDEVATLHSVALEMLGDDIYIVATPTEGVTSAMDMFECEEYIYAAVSPVLLGREIDLVAEDNTYTIMSTLRGAIIESLSPDATDEISQGAMTFEYENNVAMVKGEITLADGTELRFYLSAEKQVAVNENIISRGSEEKPLRSAFYMEEDGLTYLYFTPAGITYFAELELTTWYLYFVFDSTLANGLKHNISAATLEMFGLVDNLDSSRSFDLGAEDMDSATGDFTVTRRGAGDYQAVVNVVVEGVAYNVEFNGVCTSVYYEPEERSNYFIYDGNEYAMISATLSVEDALYKFSLNNTGGRPVELTAPQSFFNGNSYGFSQSADFVVSYNRRTYSKANGDSGTLTAIYNAESQSLELHFTNYAGLEFSYSGEVTVR